MWADYASWQQAARILLSVSLLSVWSFLIVNLLSTLVELITQGCVCVREEREKREKREGGKEGGRERGGREREREGGREGGRQRDRETERQR